MLYVARFATYSAINWLYKRLPACLSQLLKSPFSCHLSCPNFENFRATRDGEHRKKLVSGECAPEAVHFTRFNLRSSSVHLKMEKSVAFDSGKMSKKKDGVVLPWDFRSCSRCGLNYVVGMSYVLKTIFRVGLEIEISKFSRFARCWTGQMFVQGVKRARKAQFSGFYRVCFTADGTIPPSKKSWKNTWPLTWRV